MHKTSATRLREENDILRGENESIMTPALKERDRQIELWQEKNKELYDQIGRLQEWSCHYYTL